MQGSLHKLHNTVGELLLLVSADLVRAVGGLLGLVSANSHHHLHHISLCLHHHALLLLAHTSVHLSLLWLLLIILNQFDPLI